MTRPALVLKFSQSRGRPVATAATALAIFILDTVTPQDVVGAILYVAVVLMASSFCKPREIWLVFLGCVALTVLSYFLSPPATSQIAALSDRGFAVMAMALTAFLSMRYQAATGAVREQANLLNLTHDSIFVRDMQNIITYWNRGAEEFYGWTAAQVVGKVATHQLLRTVFPVPLDEINAELLRTGHWEGELVHTKADGTKAVVASRWSLQRDEQQRPQAILELNNDITSRRQVQAALQEAQEDLARVNRVMLLSELTASIAHEVNQPLAAIASNANAATRWLGTTPPHFDEASAALERIVRDSLRAGKIINRVSGLVKKEAPHEDFFDINTIIRKVIAVSDDVLQKNHVVLRTGLSPGLPVVTGDRMQVQQVILNLITNAVEAMKGKEGGQRELTVNSGWDDENELFVEVKDSGTGLDPAHLGQLFESFHTTKPGGMGLGLAISRSIIKDHGGRIWAAPNQPCGAVFRFTLPVQKVSSKS